MNSSAPTIRPWKTIVLAACLAMGTWLAAAAVAQHPVDPVPVPAPQPRAATPPVVPPADPTTETPADTPAPQPATLITHIGRIARVEGEENRITVTIDEREQLTLNVPDDAQVVLNSQPAKLEDLQPGDTVRVVIHYAEPEEAESVIATRTPGVSRDRDAARPGPRERRDPQIRRQDRTAVMPGNLFLPRDGRLFVSEVRPDSPASDQGLRAGDTIVITGPRQSLPVDPLVPEAVRGERESITIGRDGTLTFRGTQQREVQQQDVQRDPRQQDVRQQEVRQQDVRQQDTRPQDVQQQDVRQRDGRQVDRQQERTRQRGVRRQTEFRQSGVEQHPHGLYIPRAGRVLTATVQSDSPAERAGLRAGDTILLVAPRQVLPPDDLVTDPERREPLQPAELEAGLLITPHGRLRDER